MTDNQIVFLLLAAVCGVPLLLGWGLWKFFRKQRQKSLNHQREIAPLKKGEHSDSFQPIARPPDTPKSNDDASGDQISPGVAAFFGITAGVATAFLFLAVAVGIGELGRQGFGGEPLYAFVALLSLCLTIIVGLGGLCLAVMIGILAVGFAKSRLSTRTVLWICGVFWVIVLILTLVVVM